MYQKKNNRKKIWVAVTVFLFLMATSMYAMQYEQMPKEKTTEEVAKYQEQMMTAGQRMTAGQGMLCKAKDLIGSDVKSKTSMSMKQDQKSMETIGKVKELIIDENQDRVYYVIVSSDNKNHPVPWWAFDVSKGQMRAMDTNDVNDTNEMSRGIMAMQGSEKKTTLCLNISKEQFQQAPTIDVVSTVNLSDADMRQKINSFYSQHVTGKSWQMSSRSVQERQQPQDSNTMSITREREMQKGAQYSFNETAPVKLLKSSGVIGLKLQGTKGGDFGSIKDLVIDDRSGQIAYGLVSFGGFVGIGEKIAAVPWTCLTVQPEQRIAKIDATEQAMEASIIEHGNIDKLSQPQFARKIYDNFGVQPYWEVFGFVPGEMRSMAAWGADSEYSRNFDPSKVTTFRGSIESVSTFEPEPGAAYGLALMVKTSDSELMTVHAGPQQYAIQQGIDLKTGNRIAVTGSTVRFNGQTVIMASQVTSGDKILKLRDSQGKPQWKMEQQQQQEPLYQYKN